jgi:hypothetical protein
MMTPGMSMPKKRTFSSRRRRTKVRDARLIIIATEGKETEPAYFEALARHYRNSKIHVEVLPTGEENRSAPLHVMRRLREFKKQFDLTPNDELWMVIDRDDWDEKHLSDVVQQCHQANYYVADSNPCFEIWLLLHFVDIASDYSEKKKQSLQQNPKSGNRTLVENELLKHTGEYNKSNLKIEQYLPLVESAIQYAQLLDTNPNHRWLHTIGSRVYHLVNSIRDKTP